VRRAVPLVAFAGALALSGGFSARAATITPAGELAFPNRQYVLSLPSAEKIDPSEVKVLENGQPVASPSVLPASAANGRALGVVLVIDTSRSMTGPPIAAAFAAARAFAAHRNPQQQLGIVTFNGAPTVALRPMSNAASIDRALATTPRLGRDTHIYDAVDVAIKMLRSARISGGSIVVLSDGSDTGSAMTQEGVVSRAEADGIRIYAVGLRSGAFDPTALSELAHGGQGTYSEAGSTAALAKIYDELGSELSSQYLVRYRSLASPHRRVTVTVKVQSAGIETSSSYVTPALPQHFSPPFHRSFIQGNGAVALVGLICAALLGLTLWTILTTRPHRRSLHSRVADFVAPAPEAANAKPRAPRLIQRFLGAADDKLARKAWWGNFKEELDVAGVDMPAGRIAAATAVATILAVSFIWWVTGAAVIALLGVGMPFLVRAAVHQKLNRQRSLFDGQLADNLQVIASALRAGQSFSGALAVAVNDAPQPTRREFERVVADERIGIPLEESLGVVARRMANRDLEQVQLVAALQRRTGGNMAEVLDRAADTIRERADIRRLVKTLTAQGRLSRWVLTLIPIVLAVILTGVNPGYLDPLFSTGTGRTLLIVCVVMVMAGSLVIKRIVEIEV
jgi:Flp pilus assembly protein TadB